MGISFAHHFWQIGEILTEISSFEEYKSSKVTESGENLDRLTVSPRAFPNSNISWLTGPVSQEKLELGNAKVSRTVTEKLNSEQLWLESLKELISF